MSKMTWKRNPRMRGLASITQGVRGSTLSAGDVVYASTAYVDGKWNDGAVGWYWAAPGNQSAGIVWKNTCNSLLQTESEAKAEGKKYIVAQMTASKVSGVVA